MFFKTILRDAEDSVSFKKISWKMTGEPAIPIVIAYWNIFPQGNMMVQILDTSGFNLIM
jgi:hypothetical protein